mgnify:CR=1 FL=1
MPRKSGLKEKERKKERKRERENVTKVRTVSFLFVESYCLNEYVLCVIDEPEICGLIERRGTSC